MNEEKKRSGEIKLDSPALRWLDNFWYHYKWAVIGTAVALTILLVCVLQTCSRKSEDSMIVYAGPTYLLPAEAEQLSAVFSAVLPYDGDGNGENLAKISTYEIYSEEQIRVYPEEHAGQSIDRNRNQSEYQTYHTYQQTGQSCIYLLDPWLYESIDKAYLCPLTDSTGSLPEGALADGYGVRLGDTALYREYGALQLLPEDTVICLMNPFFMTRSWKEEAYEVEKDIFCAIVTYGGEEAENEAN